MELKDWLALYAALTATAAIWLNWRNSAAQFSVHVFQSASSGISIVIKNPSTHKIHISTMALCCPDPKEPMLRKRDLKELLHPIQLMKRLKGFFMYGPAALHRYWFYNFIAFKGIEPTLPAEIEPKSSFRISLSEEGIRQALSGYPLGKVAVYVQDALLRSKHSKPYYMRLVPKAPAA